MKYDMLEFFAGCGSANAAFKKAGKKTCSFEINDHESMDFLSPAGFGPLVCRYARMKPAKLSHMTASGIPYKALHLHASILCAQLL